MHPFAQTCESSAETCTLTVDHFAVGITYFFHTQLCFHICLLWKCSSMCLTVMPTGLESLDFAQLIGHLSRARLLCTPDLTP